MADTDPETEIEINTPASTWSQEGVVLEWQHLDPAYGNKFTFSAGALLVVGNDGGTGPLNFQVTSQPDPATGRTGDINVDVEANEFRCFRFTSRGWTDELGYVLIPPGLSENLIVAIIALPS